ncbi:hypothetical protein ABE042_04725 [Viridibacillus arvi]|uniref:hypothetical protein n=1 Tax=Viridibacillus arvi TaxID=263475 RepID=UPI003D2B2780
MPEIQLPTKVIQDLIKQVVEAIKVDTANINQIINNPVSPFKVMKSKVFNKTVTMSWTVPQGVTEVYLTGCAGGGGGYGPTDVNSIPSTSGGITSFGSLLSLTGGGGASGSNGGQGGFNGGQGGFGSRSNTTADGHQPGGTGGASLYGGNAGNTAQGSQGGGGGGGFTNGYQIFSGGGGGGGEFVVKFPITVNAGDIIPITIGKGGTGGGGALRGGNGGNGILIIEWWE